MLTDTILLTYSQSSDKRLPELCDLLLQQQRSSWGELREGYAGLKSTRVREIHCNGYSVHVQYNPRRIVSTAANVDSRSVEERRCFLCYNHLSSEQKGVRYRDEFLILCNPVPIFDRHLTIAHQDHVPQSIEGNLPVFLELARDLSYDYTVFYNGPQCGASAPDHLHVQACPTGAIPIEFEAGDPTRRNLVHTIDSVSVYTLKDVGRHVAVVESSSLSRLTIFFERLLDRIRKHTKTASEPMVNLLCSYLSGTWRLIVFPRRKHRPDMYYGTGDDRVLVSPAAVDVGGLVITPVQRDFERMNEKMIQQVYDEVLLDDNTFQSILAEMKA